MREALQQEEIWLRQWSRVPWLREGDRNTAYFQAQAAQRKRINRIQGLCRSDGSVCANEEEDKTEVQTFYHNLYESQGFTDTSNLLAHVLVNVTKAMNVELTKPYTVSEVRVALFQMAPSKAPGVDGFTEGFYQRHWDLCGEEVTKAVLRIVRGEESAECVNDTVLVLIPKVLNQHSSLNFDLLAFVT